MAVCGVCNKDTDSPNVAGCLNISLTDKNGMEVSLIPYGKELKSQAKLGDRCEGCNTSYGYPHHMACPIEMCPYCGEEPFYECECQEDDMLDYDDYYDVYDGEEDDEEDDE